MCRKLVRVTALAVALLALGGCEGCRPDPGPELWHLRMRFSGMDGGECGRAVRWLDAELTEATVDLAAGRVTIRGLGGTLSGTVQGERVAFSGMSVAVLHAAGPAGCPATIEWSGAGILRAGRITAELDARLEPVPGACETERSCRLRAAVQIERGW